MWAYFKGDRNTLEIVERDDWFITASTMGPRHYFAEYKNWAVHERQAMRHAKGSVLDIGCGMGRHALYLQRGNHNVTCIDNSPLAIRICRLRGVKKAQVRSITEVSKFKPDFFDTIIMMGNNFGLLGSFRRAKVLLKKFHRITTPVARIVAEVGDPYKTKEPAHLFYHTFNRKRGRMAGQLRIRIRHKRCIGNWFDYLFVSKRELRDIIKDTGWKVKKFINSKTTHSYIVVLDKVV